MIKHLIALTFIIFVGASCTKKSSAPGDQWSANFKQGQTIGLDVRTPGEVGMMPSTNGLNIPISELKQKVAAQIPNKNTQIYVFCRSGGRSGQSITILKDLGYTNVTDVKTWKNWNELHTPAQ